jgi:hypothetical protein
VEYVGVRIEEPAGRGILAAEIPVDEPDFVRFATAGMQLSGEFRCADCGYGAVVHRVVPLCPMCSGTIWELRGPVARRLDDR